MLYASGVARLVKLIDAERERQGLSGRELAARAGIGAGTISKILSDHAVPEMETIDALAQALGFSLETFLAMALASSRKHPDTELIADVVDQLSEGERRAVLTLAAHFRDSRQAGQRSP